MNAVVLAPLIIAVLFVVAVYVEAKYVSKEPVAAKRVSKYGAMVFCAALAVTAASVYAGDQMSDIFSALTDQPLEISATRPAEILTGKPNF
jgi:succinate dehydrogenase hydrophobic anchor subunit